MVLARMLQAATVVPTDRVLDVAGGSGYGAACLPPWARRLSSWNPTPAQRKRPRAELHNRASVTVVVGPLDSGAAALGPFDLIVVEGAFGVFPDSLIALMADPGRLVGIDASSEPSQAVIYEKSGGGLSRRALFETKAEILDGFKPASELRLLSHWIFVSQRTLACAQCLIFATLGGKMGAMAADRRRFRSATGISPRMMLGMLLGGLAAFGERAGGGVG